MSRLKYSLSLAFLMAAIPSCGGHHHHGRCPRMGGVEEGLHVSGQGEVRAAPDVARATLGVEVRASTAEEATERLAQQMGVVLTALRNQGVADKDLQTAQLNVYFERTRFPEPPPRPLPAPEGGTEVAPSQPPPVEPEGVFRAMNTVNVTIRDIDKASQVIGAATAAGANAVHGISFELDDDSVAIRQARELAMTDAKNNAEHLARTAGVSLGPILSIRESHSGGPVYRGVMMHKEAAMAADSMPVEKGELVITRQVEVLYSLGSE